MIKAKNSLKKAPFSVLTKKGLTALAMAGIMVATPFMLSGCSDGKDGNDGTIWKSGTSYTEFTDAKVGDYFIDTDNYILYQKSATGWSIVMENYGRPGIPGDTGTPGVSSYTHIKYSATMPDSNDDMVDTANDYIGIYVGTSETAPTDYTAYCWYKIKGEPGEDGISVYIGYDGYIWEGAKKTNLSYDTIEEGVVENTLELKENRFFTTKTISAGTKIALMANYMPNAKLTQYSNSIITELTTYVSTSGKLDLGVINLQTGVYTSKQVVDVTAGENTLTPNIKVENNETFVLGGANTTVDLYAKSGVEADDEYGLFTCDLTNFDYSQTNNVNDKLVINIKATFPVEGALFDDVFDLLPESAIFSSRSVSHGKDPFAYYNDYFSTAHITRIGIPVKSVETLDENQTFTVSIIDRSTTSYTIKDEIVLTLPLDQLGESTDVGKYIYVDVDIELGENETLGFGSTTDTVDWVFISNQPAGNKYSFRDSGTASWTLNSSWTHSLIFDIYGESFISFEDQINKIKSQEEDAVLQEKIDALAEILTGKNLSILGDSISTYEGWSNNTDANDTIGDNAVYYGGTDNDGSSYLNSVEQTWWYQIADKTEMNILVNNSYSGDQVLDYGQTRCEQLHDNSGDNAGTNPDIIAVYFGINDFDRNETLEDIQVGYDTMVSKIADKYADAEIYLFTHVPNGKYTRSESELQQFNQIIKDIAEKYKCKVVNLYENSGITSSNYATYMADGSIHPNSAGMDIITNCFWNVLYETYITNAD